MVQYDALSVLIVRGPTDHNLEMCTGIRELSVDVSAGDNDKIYISLDNANKISMSNLLYWKFKLIKKHNDKIPSSTDDDVTRIDTAINQHRNLLLSLWINNARTLENKKVFIETTSQCFLISWIICTVFF